MKFFSYFKNKTRLFLIILIWLSTTNQTYADNRLEPLHFDLIKQFSSPDSVLLLPTYIPKDLELQYFSLSEDIVGGYKKSYYIAYKYNQNLNHQFTVGGAPNLQLSFGLSGPIASLFSCEPAFITTWNFRNPHIGKATMCNKKIPMEFLSTNNTRQSIPVTQITVLNERMNISVYSTRLSQEEVIKVLDSIQVIPQYKARSVVIDRLSWGVRLTSASKL